MCPASLHFVGMILSDVPPDEHPQIAYVCIVSEDIWPTATRISLPFDPKLQLAFARSPTITLQVYKRSNITSAIKYVWAFFSPSQVGRPILLIENADLGKPRLQSRTKFPFTVRTNGVTVFLAQLAAGRCLKILKYYRL